MAWLALLAMAFIVVVPVVSRLMPGAQAMSAADASCPYHLAADEGHPSSPHAPPHLMEWCGYCVLLHHSPLLGTGTVVHWVAAVLPANVPLLGVAPGSHESFRLSADPRGPPPAMS